MKLFRPAVLSAKQVEYREKIRAQGRKHYIVYTGIRRWGMSVFILTSLWSWYEEYGWHVPLHGYLWFSVILGLIIWSVAGYFWGAYMWRRLFEDQYKGVEGIAMENVSTKIEGYELTSDELLKRMPKEQAITFVQGILRRMEESLSVPDIPAAKARMEKVLEELKLSQSAPAHD